MSVVRDLVYLLIIGILATAWYVDRSSLHGKLSALQADLESAEDANAILEATLPEAATEQPAVGQVGGQ